MKRIRYILLMACLCIICTGCKHEKEEEISGPKLYYINQDATKLVTESYTEKAEGTSALVDEYLIALGKQPENEEYKLAKPAEIKIVGYNFGSAGLLQISFDDSYTMITGVYEVLMRAAIVKTFTQIPGITSIEFFINGVPLSLNGETPLGRMEADDFIDNVGEMTSYTQTAIISIYFSNEKGDALLESQRQVEYDGSIQLEQVIVEQLIEGPTEKEEGMKRTLPETVVLNKVSKKDGVCTVDFSQDFLTAYPEVTDEVTIYSIVNTLAEQPSIDKVQFTIDGDSEVSYQTIPLNQAFERNLNIIESEK